MFIVDSIAQTSLVPKRRKWLMYLYTLASIVGGGALGYAYYRFVGCSSGACPITANPYVSTLYGALMGFLIGGSFTR
jgi:hypothetical protein